MTVDLTAMDAANKALQADPKAAASTKAYAQANTNTWHAAYPTPPPAVDVWWTADSFVNTKIPANAPVDPNSGLWIGQLMASSKVTSMFTNGQASVQGGGSTTVYHTAASDPIVTVTLASPNPGQAKVISVQIPTDAVATPDSDHHLTVIAPDGSLMEMQGFVWTVANKTATANSAAYENVVTGTGASLTNNWVSDLPLCTGLIRVPDVSVAPRHALRIGVPTIGSTWRYPACRSDGGTAQGIPSGALVGYQRMPDVSSLDVYGKWVVESLFEFGGYIADGSGAFSLYCDSTANPAVSYPFPLSSVPKSFIGLLSVFSAAA